MPSQAKSVVAQRLLIPCARYRQQPAGDAEAVAGLQAKKRRHAKLVGRVPLHTGDEPVQQPARAERSPDGLEQSDHGPVVEAGLDRDPGRDLVEVGAVVVVERSDAPVEEGLGQGGQRPRAPSGAVTVTSILKTAPGRSSRRPLGRAPRTAAQTVAAELR
jgi:hypothetical protein